MKTTFVFFRFTVYPRVFPDEVSAKGDVMVAELHDQEHPGDGGSRKVSGN